jgi:hypothetical protein
VPETHKKKTARKPRCLGQVVCDRIFELKKTLCSYVGRFDPALISTSEAQRVLEHAASMENSIRTLKALCASRVSQGDSWRKKGHRSAAEALAEETGTTLSQAKEEIETGRRLLSQEKLSRAARRGEISFAKAQLISNAAEADPKAEGRLLEEAKGSSISRLKDSCALTKAQANPDREARREQIHRRRSLRTWTDIEGVWHLSASSNPEDGAQIMSVLDPIRDEIFRAARKQKQKEPIEAYAFDALFRLATKPTGASSSAAAGRGARLATAEEASGPRSKILVRVDYESFLRGFPTAGETCEITGFGPVSVSAVKDLIRQGDPFIVAILTKGKELVGVAHLGRKPTAFQRSALEWMYPSCAIEGCNAQAHLEMDHSLEWSKTHFTMLDHLKFLCHHHHFLKSNDNWALTEVDRKCLLVPPEDPRHPRHRRSTNQSNAPPKSVA